MHFYLNWITSVSGSPVFPCIARLAVDVVILSIAQVDGAQRLVAGEAGGTFAMVGSFLNNHLLGVENLDNKDDPSTGWFVIRVKIQQLTFPLHLGQASLSPTSLRIVVVSKSFNMSAPLKL